MFGTREIERECLWLCSSGLKEGGKSWVVVSMMVVSIVVLEAASGGGNKGSGQRSKESE